MSTQDTADRREYYRINDKIALQIRLSGSQNEEGSLLFNLLADLHLLKYEAQPLLRSVGETDRALSSYLKVINKRIDLLGQVHAHNLLKDIGPARDVSLSESDLAFVDELVHPIGTLLSLKAVLLTQDFSLHVDARVLEHRDTAQGVQTVTVFEILSAATQQFGVSEMKRTSILLCLAILPTSHVQANVLRIPISQQDAARISIPGHSDQQVQVLQQFNEPRVRHQSVGQPPIRHWDYPDISVYFEYTTVVNSLQSNQPHSISAP